MGTYLKIPMADFSSSAIEKVNLFVAPSITIASDGNVTLSASDALSIRYTIDGSTPTQSSTMYSQPFIVGEGTTVKAIAVYTGGVSDVTTKKRPAAVWAFGLEDLEFVSAGAVAPGGNSGWMPNVANVSTYIGNKTITKIKVHVNTIGNFVINICDKRANDTDRLSNIEVLQVSAVTETGWQIIELNTPVDYSEKEILLGAYIDSESGTAKYDIADTAMNGIVDYLLTGWYKQMTQESLYTLGIDYAYEE